MARFAGFEPITVGDIGKLGKERRKSVENHEIWIIGGDNSASVDVNEKIKMLLKERN